MQTSCCGKSLVARYTEKYKINKMHFGSNKGPNKFVVARITMPASKALPVTSNLGSQGTGGAEEYEYVVEDPVSLIIKQPDYKKKTGICL